MNYRHAFHAGNFADVFKHVILTRILLHLRLKEAPFRVIDSHAGAGLYDLASEEALRTEEWRGGIGAIEHFDWPADVIALMAPYLDLVRAVRAEHGPNAYPGSPEIARRFLRADDRLILSETHPNIVRRLIRAVGRDPRVKVLELDGWTALKANLPPKERRGLVLIDPPFEDAQEFATIVRALEEAWRRWTSGIYAIWYPIKEDAQIEAFAADLRRSNIKKVLRAELIIDRNERVAGLRGCGMLIVNPPWTLAREIETFSPTLAEALSRGSASGWRCDWLIAEEG